MNTKAQFTPRLKFWLATSTTLVILFFISVLISNAGYAFPFATDNLIAFILLFAGFINIILVGITFVSLGNLIYKIIKRQPIHLAQFGIFLVSLLPYIGWFLISFFKALLSK